MCIRDRFIDASKKFDKGKKPNAMTDEHIDAVMELYSKREIKVIDNAIEKEIKGLNPNAFIILQSIDAVSYTHLDVYKRQQ